MKLNEFTKITGRTVVLVPYRSCHVLKYNQWMSSTELQELTASEPLSLEEELVMQGSWRNDDDKCTFIILDKEIYERTGDEIEAMIGDTNIFLTDPEDRSTGEIEIMIAEQLFRGKGRGKEATLMMLKYGSENLSIKNYEAKIGLDNKPSISMFNRMGFREVTRSEIFNECTLHVSAADPRLLSLFSNTTCTTQESS